MAAGRLNLTAQPKIIKETPVSALIEKILIETDAPQEYPGVPSEPAHLLNTVALLSRIKKLPVSETARITTENAHRFYSMPQSDERKP